jgi:hypothetical protein
MSIYAIRLEQTYDKGVPVLTLYPGVRIYGPFKNRARAAEAMQAQFAKVPEARFGFITMEQFLVLATSDAASDAAED